MPVGFQNRTGTYTGKLAYVIYYDQKGVLRKEKSWQSWRDHKIDDVEFENIPTEGFVLNKGVGGARQSYGWNARNEYIRVYDPRDFEFEISVANLLFILREGDCSRGKGLEGKFVYSWDGTELVLLPECSLDYQNSKKFTQLQTCSVKARDLIPGASYITKKQNVYTYLGQFNYYSVVSPGGYYFGKKHKKGVEKQHIFWDGKSFIALGDMKSIATLQSDVIAPNYAELVDMYIRSPHGSRAFKLFLKEVEPQGNDYYTNVFFFQEGDAYIECHPDHYPGNKPRYIYLRYRVTLQDGIVHAYCDQRVCSAYGSSLSLGHALHPWVEPTKQRLFVGLESGSVYRLYNGELHEEVNDGKED